MAAIAKSISRASGIQADIETVKTLVRFCGAGLVVSLVLAINGLAVSTGFF
jgi:hypothetical protein